MRCRQSGLSLVELLIVLVVGGILLAGVIGVFTKYLPIMDRQSRLQYVERQCNDLHSSLGRSLITLPGRGLNYYSGTSQTSLVIPSLPANGTVANGSVSQPVPLDLVTPYRVNGYDAFTVCYAREESPRLELVEDVVDLGNGKCTVHATAPDLDLSSSGRPSLPTSVPGFHIGDLFLVIGSPSPNGNLFGGRLQTCARLMRATSAARIVTIGSPSRSVAEITMDYCESGNCGTSNNYPYLFNMPINKSVKLFGMGTTVVPIELLSFYIDKSQSRLRLIRNEGGSIIPVQNSNSLTIDWQVVGGENSFIGELDDFQVSYVMADGSKQSSPPDPLSTTFINPTTPEKLCVALEIMVSKSITSTIGNEKLARAITKAYPIMARSLE